MRKNHCLNKAESRCQAGRDQGGKSSKNIRAEEDPPEHRRVHPETEIKPIRSKALNDETAVKWVEPEQAR